MAVQFKASGTVLFKSSGSVAMDADCCCDPLCCPGAPDAPLFITISDLTLDAGETCDAGCLPSATAEESIDSGGGEASDTDISATWLFDTGDPGFAVLATLVCDGGTYAIAMDGALVQDAGGATICVITTDPALQQLTGHTCDPFFWEGDISVTVQEPGGAVCGSGTIHVVISE